MAMTRAEHLAWAKARALEYVDEGNLNEAFTSFASDLGKHPDLRSALELQTSLGMMQFMAGHLNTPQKMREWIEGFN